MNLPRSRLNARLESELAADLEGSRGLGTARLTEVSTAPVGPEGVELGVIEGVEALGAQLEMSAFADREGLVQVGSEVGAARDDDGVSAGVAKAKVRATEPSCCRRLEGVSRNPLVNVASFLLRIANFLRHVGTDG